MGKGYIDDTPADQMKEERGEGVVSKRRNASVEVNEHARSIDFEK